MSKRTSRRKTRKTRKTRTHRRHCTTRKRARRHRRSSTKRTPKRLPSKSQLKGGSGTMNASPYQGAPPIADERVAPPIADERVAGLRLVEDLIKAGTRDDPTFILGMNDDRNFGTLQLRWQANQDPRLGRGGGHTEWWIPNKIVDHCTDCTNTFSISNRKHHCRGCGNIFCGGCLQEVETHWHVSKGTHTLKYTKQPIPKSLCNTCKPILGYKSMSCFNVGKRVIREIERYDGTCFQNVEI